MASRLNCTWLILAMTLGLTEAQAATQAEQPTLAAWQEGYIQGLLAGQGLFIKGSVQVSVDGRTAELTGQVASKQARALAEQLALSAKGIDAVVNRLRIEPVQAVVEVDGEEQAQRYRLSNVTINNKVMSRILAHAQTRGLNIDVQTNNRSVTVSGLVTSPVERELVYWLVKNTEGVVEVIDHLHLANELPQQAGL